MPGPPPGGMPGGPAPPMAIGMPGGPPAAMAIGAPGGLVGPPGGLAPPPLAPLAPPPLPLLPAYRAGPWVQETHKSAHYPGPPPLGGAPGGALPGAGVPLALPDLHGVARRAIESVVEQAPERPAPRPAPAAPAQESLPIGSQTPHVAAAPVGWEALPPPPPPGASAHPEHVPGVWRRPARRRARAPRRALEVPTIHEDERDLAQRIGDGLYPLVEWVRDSRAGWIGVVLLFGLTAPIILLRQRFDVRLRLVLAAVVFFFWIGLIQDLL